MKNIKTILKFFLNIYILPLADFGKSIVDDCNSMCKGNSKNIVTCWNLFQSAVACHNLGRNKEADFFIDYINKQLENVYRGTDKTVYNNTVALNITEDGKLKAIASCDNEINFYVIDCYSILCRKAVEYYSANDSEKHNDYLSEMKQFLLRDDVKEIINKNNS